MVLTWRWCVADVCARVGVVSQDVDTWRSLCDWEDSNTWGHVIERWQLQKLQVTRVDTSEVVLQRLLWEMEERSEIYPMVLVVFWSEVWNKKYDEGSGSFGDGSTFDGSRLAEIVLTTKEQDRRWLRQRKNAIKD